MTSSVISSCALVRAFSRGSAKKGFSVPKASECRTTETRDSGGSAAADPLDRGDHLRALLVVGGVDVEELGPAAGRADLARDPVGVRLRPLAVEVDAEDVPAGAAELERAGFAEPGRSAQDEGPAVG